MALHASQCLIVVVLSICDIFYSVEMGKIHRIDHGVYARLGESPPKGMPNLPHRESTRLAYNV